MLGTDTAVEIQTHTTAKRPTERNSVGDTSPFVHLYEIVLRRASTWPTAIAIGGQEGLTWKTLKAASCSSSSICSLRNWLAKVSPQATAW